MRQKVNKKFMLLSALGILMVVDAHSGSTLGLFTNFFPYNSFFMPMFAFVSGYFDHTDQNCSILECIKKKSVRWMIPYFGISLFVWIMGMGLNWLQCGNPLFPSFQEMAAAIIRIVVTGDMVSLAEPLWFVPTLYVGVILFTIIKKYMMRFRLWNDLIMLTFFGVLNIAVVCIAKNGLLTYHNLLIFKALFFLVFIQLGVIYRDYLEEQLQRINKFVVLFGLIILNAVRLMILPNTSDIVFINLRYLGGFTSPYYYTPILSSVIGIWFWLTMVELVGSSVQENRVLNYISINTFWIMGMHLCMMNVLNTILKIIHTKLIQLPGFDINGVLSSWWYKWEPIPAFGIIYFAFGGIGSLATKMLFDKICGRFTMKKQQDR